MGLKPLKRKLHNQLQRLSIQCFFTAISVMVTIQVWQLMHQSKEKDNFFCLLEGPMPYDDPQLISHLKQNFLTPPSKKEYNLSSRRSPVHNYLYRRLSWKFVHNYTLKLFGNQTNGFFVEAGALDGEILSNTLWLEMNKRWTGLLIEPNQASFAALKERNRKAWISQACLSTVSYPKISTFKLIAPSIQGKRRHRGMTWFQRGLTFDTEKTLENSDVLYEGIYTQVQCFPLESFFIALNITEVDFLSLDIQGGEWEILKYFPWMKVKLRALAVELYVDSHNQDTLNQDFIDYMINKGYMLLGTSFEPDYIFILRNDLLFPKEIYNQQIK